MYRGAPVEDGIAAVHAFCAPNRAKKPAASKGVDGPHAVHNKRWHGPLLVGLSSMPARRPFQFEAVSLGDPDPATDYP